MAKGMHWVVAYPRERPKTRELQLRDKLIAYLQPDQLKSLLCAYL